MTRAKVGITLAVVGGVGLVAALFAPWYVVGGILGVNGAPGPGDLDALRLPRVSGWSSLSLVDLWAAVAGVAAVALALARRTGPVPLVLRGAALAATGVGLVLVVFRFASPPDLGVRDVTHGVVFGALDGFGLVSRAWGAWLALAAAVTATAGAALLLEDGAER